jgi:hypothetical protein
MAQHDGIEPRRLAQADYRAVTVRLILGNIGRGDDQAEGGGAPLSRGSRRECINRSTTETDRSLKHDHQ